ncbi:hypothetical protein [uncultured Roseobacter sp.]|uniref:hypothetical protein n=1 Tax=uncultured Roseobacter sp. TaxID=114847 RepID=UPI00260E9D0E|nr:hypothetical protein [uncultured Roseobacter sp.]
MNCTRRKTPAIRVFPAVALLSAIAGCAELQKLEQAVNLELGGSGLPELSAAQEPAAGMAPQAASPALNAGGARSAESIDSTSTAQRTAAAQVSATGAALGRTVASLGNPAEQGFWLKTPLVPSEMSGVVTDTETGASVKVTLIPIDGPATAGSRISLAAMRVLNAPLTALVTLSVRRGS